MLNVLVECFIQKRQKMYKVVKNVIRIKPFTFPYTLTKFNIKKVSKTKLAAIFIVK